MSNIDDSRRLKYYGATDSGTYMQGQRIGELLDAFQAGSVGTGLDDVLELASLRKFITSGVVLNGFREERMREAQALVPDVDAVTGRFFGTLTEDNIAERLSSVAFEYHSELLTHLARHGVFKKLQSSVVLPVLDRLDISLAELLATRALVDSYGSEIRDYIFADEHGAELIVRKHLAKDERQEILLPKAMSVADGYMVIEKYIDSDDPNMNILQLVANAKGTQENGIDAKLRLKARRRYDVLVAEFFENNGGMKTGVQVEFSDTQVEESSWTYSDGLMSYSYSTQWLLEGLDYPTIFNNFVYLFEFANDDMLLRLPAYKAEMGTFERLTLNGGKSDYEFASAFRNNDSASRVQLGMYDRFLATHDIRLEDGLKWFVSTYLPAEFGVQQFNFSPSSRAATYLERCRHLFVELEGMAAQYKLYVENGELDTELLAMSGGVTYKQLPTSVAGKYIYLTDDGTIIGVMNLLFSDQSGLTYINDQLKADNAVSLIAGNRITYDQFHEYQQSRIDHLLSLGVLKIDDGRVRFVNANQIAALAQIWRFEAASYFHFDQGVRDAIDEMIGRGWLRRASTLLTEAEASYFNYYLNNVEFGNGPALRNRYSHSSPVPPGDEARHFQNYVVALRMLICVVIKINDDLSLQAELREQPHEERPLP